MQWYKISVPLSKYIQALKPIYDVLQGASVKQGDPLVNTILFSHAGMNEYNWRSAKNYILYEKALESKMEEFYKEIGSSPNIKSTLQYTFSVYKTHEELSNLLSAEPLLLLT